MVGFFIASPKLKTREFQSQPINTDFPKSVLTCWATLPKYQRVNKHFEPQMTLKPVLESADAFDTDAVWLLPEHCWIHNSFKLYQWRLGPLGLTVEPWEIASVSFNRPDWELAHGFCHTLISELNIGPLSNTARQLLAYASNCTVSK